MYLPLLFTHISQLGGGIKDTTNTEIKQVTQEPSAKKEVLKVVKTFNLALTDTDVDNGVYAKVTLEQEGDKKTWNVNEVTWRNSRWQNNWTLYYDDVTRNYTFTDSSGIRMRHPCYGSEKRWRDVVACFAFGRVAKGYENVWEEKFLRVKLDNSWSSRQTTAGYYANSMPNYLEGCKNATVTEKPNTDLLEVSIRCKNATLYKSLKNPEETGSFLSK